MEIPLRASVRVGRLPCLAPPGPVHRYRDDRGDSRFNAPALQEHARKSLAQDVLPGVREGCARYKAREQQMNDTHDPTC